MTDHTADSSAGPELQVISGSGAGTVIPLPTGDLLIGRNDPQAGALADDPLLSRRHARVSADGGHVYIEDLGSSNGTRVNGVTIRDRQLLRPGDIIEVGGSRLQLVASPWRTGPTDPAAPPGDRTVISRITPDSDPPGTARAGTWNGLMGSAPPRREGRSPAPAGPAPAGPTPGAPPSGPITVRGQIRGLERRSERQGNGTILIWNFRLERYDLHGNRLQPVAVQLRGWKIDGSLRDEDDVAVTGPVKNGTLRGHVVGNFTTGATITVQRPAGCATAGVVVALFLMLSIGIPMLLGA